jgi:hypothetical protein
MRRLKKFREGGSIVREIIICIDIWPVNYSVSPNRVACILSIELVEGVAAGPEVISTY